MLLIQMRSLLPDLRWSIANPLAVGQNRRTWSLPVPESHSTTIKYLFSSEQATYEIRPKVTFGSWICRGEIDKDRNVNSQTRNRISRKDPKIWESELCGYLIPLPCLLIPPDYAASTEFRSSWGHLIKCSTWTIHRRSLNHLGRMGLTYLKCIYWSDQTWLIWLPSLYKQLECDPEKFHLLHHQNCEIISFACSAS